MSEQTNAGRLSDVFSRTYKVLVQIYPLHWDGILQTIEDQLVGGKTAAVALRAVNVCRGLPDEIRKTIIASVMRDGREIQRGQQNFHTPLTSISLDQLVSGDEVGFFSFLPGSVEARGLSQPSQVVIHSSGLTFVSHHTNADGWFANTLVRDLERRHCKCWIAPRDTKGGHWNKQVLGAVHACTAFIALLSEEALTSDRLVGEIQIAVARNKHIIPVRLTPTIDPAAFDIGLQPRHYLDCFDREGALDVLGDQLEKFIGERLAS